MSALHIDCSSSGGSPITGTVGINLAYGDGNTFTGGDVESCDTMLALGAGATNNTFIGVRNENSNSQIAAATGSSYNLWLTGGTMFTGKLSDSGTHNSFADAFHRSCNNLNGDLWRSQSGRHCHQPRLHRHRPGQRARKAGSMADRRTRQPRQLSKCMAVGTR